MKKSNADHLQFGVNVEQILWWSFDPEEGVLNLVPLNHKHDVLTVTGDSAIAIHRALIAHSLVLDDEDEDEGDDEPTEFGTKLREDVDLLMGAVSSLIGKSKDLGEQMESLSETLDAVIGEAVDDDNIDEDDDDIWMISEENEEKLAEDKVRADEPISASDESPVEYLEDRLTALEESLDYLAERRLPKIEGRLDQVAKLAPAGLVKDAGCELGVKPPDAAYGVKTSVKLPG